MSSGSTASGEGGGDVGTKDPSGGVNVSDDVKDTSTAGSSPRLDSGPGGADAPTAIGEDGKGAGKGGAVVGGGGGGGGGGGEGAAVAGGGGGGSGADATTKKKSPPALVSPTLKAGTKGVTGGTATALREVLRLRAERKKNPPKLPKIDWGWTKEELDALAAMRESVKGVKCKPFWKQDMQLMRFLRARELKLDAAVDMFVAAMKWREESGADNLIETYEEPEAMRGYFPSGFHGYDKDGFPLLIERIGEIDLVGMSTAVGEKEFLRWVAWYHEVQELVMEEATLRTGKPRHAMTVIVDLKGLGVRHISGGTIHAIKARTKLEEANYPEVVRRVFLIRAPRLFPVIYKVVRPFLAEGTREKIHVLSASDMGSMYALCPKVNVPKYIGGECECYGHPECRSTICPGGQVPENLRSGFAAASVLTVKNGTVNDLEIVVGKGDEVSWRYKVKEKNIGFHVRFHEGRTEPRTPEAAKPDEGIVSSSLKGLAGEEISEHTKAEEASGKHVASKSGTLVLRFDNTFSWRRNKVVLRQVEVVTAKQRAAMLAALEEAKADAVEKGVDLKADAPSAAASVPAPAPASAPSPASAETAAPAPAPAAVP